MKAEVNFFFTFEYEKSSLSFFLLLCSSSLHLFAKPHSVQKWTLLFKLLPAQDEYTVFYCRVDDPAKEQIKKYPLNGIWIFPSVLGRRDLLLHW